MKYFENFSGYSAGNNPQGFTGRISRGGDSYFIKSDSSGIYLNLLKGSTAGTFIVSWDVLNGITDNIELLVKFRMSSDVEKQGIAALRYSGNSEATTAGYVLSGSFIRNAGQLALDEGTTGYVAWTPWNYEFGYLYWSRFRLDGNRLRGKVWRDGVAEPDWMIDTTNNVASTGLYNGVHTYASGNIEVRQISAGTNGDSAPMVHTQLAANSHSIVTSLDELSMVQEDSRKKMLVYNNGWVNYHLLAYDGNSFEQRSVRKQ